MGVDLQILAAHGDEQGNRREHSKMWLRFGAGLYENAKTH